MQLTPFTVTFAFRKKCVGRLRKQVADYTLLTGLPALALDAYQSAIDCLKATTDLLWLGGTPMQHLR